MAQILIVDDDGVFGKQMQDQLEKASYKVKWLGSGEEALDYVQNNPGVSLIFLDYELSGMDGFSVLKKIKESGNLGLIKVVMLSNHGEMEKLGQAKELGVVDYVVKAMVNFDKLRELVDKYLK